MDELLRAGFAALGLPLDAAALARFQTYYTLLDERSKVMNLTAIHGETDVAQLHFLDSAALLTVEPLAGKSVIDVGTGAGFPGLPLKIAQPDISLTLLDSLDKRVRFLGDVCAATGLTDVTCLHARAEEAPELRGQFDAAVSRAVARLYLLCELCLPFVRTGGVFLAMKGPDCAEELDEARSAIGKLGGMYERTVRYTIPGTDVTCLHARAEEAPELRGQFDAAVSRAVARLYLLCELCLPFVRTGGVFLAMKGPDCAEELDEARSAIGKLGGMYERTVRYTIPGTDVTHSVVVIRKTAPTPPKYPRRWAKMQKEHL